jgi:3-methyladenine DNA glycosylase/8-oxoguanine DNA glycosylase
LTKANVPDITAQLETPPSYNLRHTMSSSRMGLYDPVTQIKDDAFAFALHTPEGHASVAVRQSPDTVDVEGWGEGAPWLTPHLRALLGLDDDASAFTPEGGVVRQLWRRFPGIHLPRFPRVFDRVVRVTLLQLVTWQEACRSWGRMVRELGEASPGPIDVRLPPSAETLKSTPDYELIGYGIRPKQARTILRLAKYAGRIEEAAAAGPELLATRLNALSGIGPWTIAYVLGNALGYSDAVLLGDYSLHHTVAYVLAGEPRATQERMIELLEPYRGHRFRVIRLLWMNGVSAPRRGPRHDAYRPQ